MHLTIREATDTASSQLTDMFIMSLRLNCPLAHMVARADAFASSVVLPPEPATFQPFGQVIVCWQ